VTINSGAKIGERTLRRLLVTVALANKTARIVWALLAKNENYRAPAVAA
jgi:hypothetical protein